MAYYTWSTLTHPQAFRLLHLHEDATQGQIACIMTEEVIGSSPPYTAISHHWGNRKLTHELVCYGKRVAITATLHAMFTQILNRSDLNKTLWIDAICIDQRDNNEKAQQVRLMKDIFSNASLTIVYLGQPENPRDVPAMLDLGNNIIDMTRKVPPRTLREEDLADCGLPAIEHPSWKTLANLFCLPWFNRVWIVQEYVLANDILFLYGEYWKPGDYFVCISRALTHSEDSYGLEGMLRTLVSRPKQTSSSFYDSGSQTRWLGISTKLSHMQYFRSMRSLNVDFRKWAMRMLTARSNATQATDSRDYIYGMLGLLPEEAAAHRDLQPDYTEPYYTAYTRLARFVLETQGLPNLLSSVGFPGHAVDYPSWVPDWSKQRVPTTIHRQAMLPVPNKYGRPDAAPWRLDSSDVPQRLYVRGVILDTIDKIESILARVQRQPGIATNQCLIEFIFATANLMIESANLLDLPPADHALRHLHTLSLADPPEESSGCLTHAELAETAIFVAPYYDFKDPTPLVNNPDLQTQIAHRLARIHVSDMRTGFCLLKNGDIGRVSHETRIGDKVCFFQGVDIPFVLRETGENTAEYLVIDHCFVEGKMEGKFWQQQDRRTQEICLV